MQVPAYVCLITENHVCLSGGVGSMRAGLRESALRTRLGRYLGYLAVSFDGSRDDLAPVLVELNRLGLCFGEDHRQGWSPAEIMRDLQARGVLSVPFTTIAWRGPGDWFTAVHDGGAGTL